MTEKTTLALSPAAYRAERERVIAQGRAAEIATQQEATITRLADKYANPGKEKQR